MYEEAAAMTTTPTTSVVKQLNNNALPSIASASHQLINISSANAANITVAIVSTCDQGQPNPALTISEPSSSSGSASSSSVVPLQNLQSSASHVAILSGGRKIIINNNSITEGSCSPTSQTTLCLTTTSSSPNDALLGPTKPNTNKAIIPNSNSTSNKTNVIVSTHQIQTEDYQQMLQQQQQLIITTTTVPTVSHQTSSSDSQTNAALCEVTTLQNLVTTSEQVTPTTSGIIVQANNETTTEDANGSMSADNMVEFDIQDLNNCSTDDTSEGYAGGGGTGNGNGNGGSSNADNNSSNSQNPGYISIFPSVAAGLPDQTDLKDIIEELCPVCGDKVSGYHYGLLTCESCKGFFKRTVQNKKVYTCVAERQCHIDKTQRKRCPFCRFQKCLEVGMKLEAVRADRMRGGRNKFGPMYKRDRARKLQIIRQRQLALQAIRGMNGQDNSLSLSQSSYQTPYSSMQIKQEIQIPQVSSLTSSPDSSPSPIAIALGQVNQPNNTATTLSLCGSGQSNNSSSTTNTATTIPTQLSDSKIWMANSTTASPHSLSPKTFNFDSSTNPSSTADTGSTQAETLRVSPMIREFVQSVDDREWQTSLFSLLQSQSYNQCEVDLFELMCKVLDQNLFSQVDWARNTVFFKDLKVDDQMKLLQNSWSDMLVLDHLHQRLHNGLPDETTLHNGQKFDLLGLGLLGVPSLADKFAEIQNKLQELKFDVGDYICMKFLLLLCPDVRGITNRKCVLEGYENVQAALLDYTLTCYPSVTDKFSKLLSIIPEIHMMASRGEEHLYMKHCQGSAPSQTLLMEMLHAKRK
ncbi:nuclear hormone receptor FTZ-F1 isoform X2 [Culicoides brevitarsis]|uniref:nuclear hormone receptor FTZ-F1 isoform X2 n=1 Tax=Culicoides brevitarsis TaxID=469753 RepID=UPI00307C651C